MNASRIWVFLGPSLCRDEAVALLRARYVPPAAAGDLRRAWREGAHWIGLIDGRFQQKLAVGPREVLEVIRQGVRMYGAASMGALRAAELYRDGMVGVGQVFEWYRDGLITAEDEVAVAYDPQSLRPISTPLVTIRSILDAAVSVRLIERETASRVLAAARECYFAERTLHLALERAAIPRLQARALLRIAASPNTDVKANDSRQLLNRLANDGNE